MISTAPSNPSDRAAASTVSTSDTPIGHVPHEDQVPDLQVPVLAVDRSAFLPVGRGRSRSPNTAHTDPGHTHRTEVVRHPAPLDPLRRQASDLLPQVGGLVVVQVDGHPDPLGVEPVWLRP
jgi:hypothetical protein